MDPLALSKAVPKVVKLDGLWVALLGSRVVFKSLDRKNVEAFIKHSWLGITEFDTKE